MTLNLNDGSYKLYHKADIIQYINKESNHPANVIKPLQRSIEKRLSNHSSNEKVFRKSAIYYEDTINKPGYSNKLVYHNPSASNQENQDNNCRRNIIWFNPPHGENVIARKDQPFLHLIDTHFSKCHTILTRYSIKIK